MLLDTMCNAFGGIILLTVLVVLLTSKEKNQTAVSADSQDMMQRRLALAQTNLEQSLHLADSLHAKASDVRRKEQMALLSTRKELQDTIQQTRNIVAQNGKELDAANAADPTERLNFLNAKFAAGQTQKLEAQNSLAATEENIKRLKQRLANMKAQVMAKLNDLQRPLRLPMEHETGKRVIYIIAEYGLIYPCRNADLSRNENSIVWSTIGDSHIAKPIPGTGLDPVRNQRELENYFREMSKESVYMAFCVFEDSFPAFIRTKQMTVNHGLAYGWDPFRNEDGPVSFGSSGHTPKPQ